MARDGVSEHEILKACEVLQKEGVQVTLVNVHRKLGRGSFSTIGPVVKVFKEKRNEQKAAEMIFDSPVIPQHIEVQGRGLVSSIWEVAHKTAQTELKEATQKHLHEMNLKTQELETLSREKDQLIEELTLYQDKYESINSIKSGLSNTVSQQTSEITLLKSQLAEKNKEAKSLIERAASAETELEILKKSITKSK